MARLILKNLIINKQYMKEETYEALKNVIDYFDNCVEKKRGNGWVFKEIEKLRKELKTI